MRLGKTKFKSHIKVVMHKTLSSLTSRKENKYTETLPLITTSKINIDGSTETIRYMDIITDMASK
ncbi:hypothetical protein GCM10007028_25250 [Algibacter mikhailovii]|uniref:Uncharacterized protein n=1 Tax=Algibacter mikhailovii TaxID=425498 RepID=A0A918VA85_9FLAO|nr:hypothetical protein GCM10007028_25250 [Algibacter mikhailovii]